MGRYDFDAGKDITRAIGRIGLKVQPVLGSEIARATASAIWAQNMRDFQPNPSNGPCDVFSRIKIITAHAI